MGLVKEGSQQLSNGIGISNKVFVDGSGLSTSIIIALLCRLPVLINGNKEVKGNHNKQLKSHPYAMARYIPYYELGDMRLKATAAEIVLARASSLSR
eukprot:scaffold2052_cov93-Skeletonema_dohrnii-CCMP3373.AAC.6